MSEDNLVKKKTRAELEKESGIESDDLETFDEEPIDLHSEYSSRPPPTLIPADMVPERLEVAAAPTPGTKTKIPRELLEESLEDSDGPSEEDLIVEAAESEEPDQPPADYVPPTEPMILTEENMRYADVSPEYVPVDRNKALRTALARETAKMPPGVVQSNPAQVIYPDGQGGHHYPVPAPTVSFASEPQQQQLRPEYAPQQPIYMQTPARVEVRTEKVFDIVGSSTKIPSVRMKFGPFKMTLHPKAFSESKDGYAIMVSKDQGEMDTEVGQALFLDIDKLNVEVTFGGKFEFAGGGTEYAMLIFQFANQQEPKNEEGR